MNNNDILNEVDQICWQLERLVRSDPKLVKRVKPKWKAIETAATNVARVMKLQEKWTAVPQSVLHDLCTEASAPFVKVMLGLAERKYSVNQMSMVGWWRRMMATGQESIITYFSWSKLATTFFGHEVLGSDILRVCTENQQLLENITNALSDDTCVDFRIRELLGGISMQADVKAKWKEWAKSNHPDKGGDPELFLKVKLVYDEWNEIQNKLNNGVNNANK